MPEKNNNLFLLRQSAKNQPSASVPVLLYGHITNDLKMIAKLFQALWEGAFNTLYGFKEWFLIYKDWFSKYQSDGSWSDSFAEWAPIIPIMALNHFFSLLQLNLASSLVLLSALFMSFCALSMMMNMTADSGVVAKIQRGAGLVLPGFIALLIGQMKDIIDKISVSSNQKICHYYQLVADDKNCDSLNVLTQRFLGFPLMGLSAIALIQLANKINLSYRKWLKRLYIGDQGDRVTLASTQTFEIAAIVANALISAVQKSSLLQVQGGVVIYQYLAPSREGFSQYISVFSFLLTLLPSLMTDAEKIISDNKRRRVFNKQVFTVRQSGIFASKAVKDIRYGDVIEIMPDDAGHVTLPETCGLIEVVEPVTIIYNKSGVNGESKRYTVKLPESSTLSRFDARKNISNDDAGSIHENGIIYVPGLKIEKIFPAQKLYFTVYPSATDINKQTKIIDSTYHHDLSLLNAATIKQLMLLTLVVTGLQSQPRYDSDATNFLLTLLGKLFQNFWEYTQMLLPLGVSALLSSEVMLYFKELETYEHLSIEQKDKLITLLSHLHNVIDKKREVIVVSDKTGTITTSNVKVHNIIPVSVTQDEANLVVLSTYQNLPKEEEIEEHVLLEKINLMSPIEIKKIDEGNSRHYKKTYQDIEQTTWQLGFLRELMTAVTLVKQNDKYHLVFVYASGNAPENQLPKNTSFFLQHCQEKIKSDVENKISRFRRDWAYASCDLNEKDDQLIQQIQDICRRYPAGQKIVSDDIEIILQQLHEKFKQSSLVAIAESTNELKANASSFLDDPNRHLVTGDNARACVGFSRIMFPGKEVFIYDAKNNQFFDRDYSLLVDFTFDTLTEKDLLIISKYDNTCSFFNDYLARSMKVDRGTRSYLMFSDCTPDSKALIAQKLKQRDDKLYLIAFGDGANDAKMLEAADFSVTCLVDGIKVNKNADFTDQELLKCLNVHDLFEVFQHFNLHVESKLATDLAPLICMMEKANPLYYAKSVKLALAWFFTTLTQPQQYISHLNVIVDVAIYSIFSRILSRRSLSFFDTKPLSERGLQYSGLILTHAVTANILAYAIHQPLDKLGFGEYAATIFTAFIIPLYLKYHAQLLEIHKSPEQKNTVTEERTLLSNGI